ncbi:LysE family translocator [uncultured Moraxella sp.]|uniref:LysE family translocator n=1 Tax=uncultured Moraxella sp. TaxID=263769 RepID=UPI0025EF4BC7|nr:LysE family translocator [uncultured Moraxella sp.]
MTIQLFLFFAISTLLVSATPGSNMLFAFQCGLNYGIKKTLWAMAGLMLGLLILLSASLFGLSLISQYPLILDTVKVLGAAYLAYLGVQSWFSHGSSFGSGVQMSGSQWALFRTGIWVSLSNPKAILFFAAFFPKFINFSAPLLPQYVILVIGFYIIETFWQFVYALSGQKLANWLGYGNRLLWLNRLCGVVFVIIAVALAWEVFV